MVKPFLMIASIFILTQPGCYADPVTLSAQIPQQPQSGTVIYRADNLLPGQAAILINGKLTVVDTESGVICSDVCAEVADTAKPDPRDFGWIRWALPGVAGLLPLIRGKEDAPVITNNNTPSGIRPGVTPLPVPALPAAETPEPATMILVGSGLAAMMIKRKVSFTQ